VKRADIYLICISVHCQCTMFKVTVLLPLHFQFDNVISYKQDKTDNLKENTEKCKYVFNNFEYILFHFLHDKYITTNILYMFKDYLGYDELNLFSTRTFNTYSVTTVSGCLLELVTCQYYVLYFIYLLSIQSTHTSLSNL
jgi:hypothetical protein